MIMALVLVLVCAFYPWSVGDEGYPVEGVKVSCIARGIHFLLFSLWLLRRNGELV